MKTVQVALPVPSWVNIVVLIVGIIIGWFLKGFFSPCRDMPIVKTETKTVVVRDTIKVEVPAPIKKGVVRRARVKPKKKTVDTLLAKKGKEVKVDTLNVKNDTPTLLASGEIDVPIERKEYKTDDYKAVIEGWRPSLLSMEVYPKNTITTETITRLKKPWFTLSVGPGVGYDGQNFKPYVGVQAGIVIFSK